jgi:hypothetical protein
VGTGQGKKNAIRHRRNALRNVAQAVGGRRVKGGNKVMGELLRIEQLEEETQDLRAQLASALATIGGLREAQTLLNQENYLLRHPRHKGASWKDLPDFLSGVMESESFGKAFCANCPCIEVHNSTWVMPEEDICPVDFDFSDERCCRRDEYQEIVALLAEIAGMIQEATV